MLAQEMVRRELLGPLRLEGYEDGMPEEQVISCLTWRGARGALREEIGRGEVAWVDGPGGRRLVCTEKGLNAVHDHQASEACSRGLAHWR